MSRTYKAILQGDRLQWLDDVPETGNFPLQVCVTVLEEDTESDLRSRGQKMADILAKLARIHAVDSISDPVAWQREVRQDRLLFDGDRECF
ncbi:MAG: hypothetical protein AB4290_04895 [Spirulina sp.]